MFCVGFCNCFTVYLTNPASSVMVRVVPSSLIIFSARSAGTPVQIMFFYKKM